MTELRLQDVAVFFSGGTPSKANPAFWAGTIPWVSPKDMGDERIADAEDHISEEAVAGSATRVVQRNSLLVVARSGILARRLPVALTDVPVAFNQDIKALLVDETRALPEFILWFLRSRERDVLVHGVKRGATVHSLASGFLENLQLRLPTLDEQRRIVDLLSRAASLKRLAEEAHAKARELIPALFVDIFGDPASNPKGWPKAKLSDLGKLDRGRSKHRPRNDSALYGGPHPFIQTGDVAAARGLIRTAKQYYSDVGLAQSRIWPAGTLCITIAANIAQTGVLTFPACFPDSVVGFTPGEGISTRYVQHFIDHLRPYLEQTAPQLAQKNINLEILRDVHVPVPPSELQHQFEEHLVRTEGIEQLAHTATATAELTSAALMSRLFAS